jgi:hypothetical protein
MREAKALAQGLGKASQRPALWAQGSVAAPAQEQAVCGARRGSRLAALHLADAAPQPDEVRHIRLPRPSGFKSSQAQETLSQRGFSHLELLAS